MVSIMNSITVSSKDVNSSLLVSIFDTVAKISTSGSLSISDLTYSRVNTIGTIHLSAQGINQDEFDKSYIGSEISVEAFESGTAYVITVIQSNGITAQQLLSLFQQLHAKAITTTTVKILSQSNTEAVNALDVFITVADSTDLNGLKSLLYTLSAEIKADIAIQKDDIYRKHKRLFVFDMDSTLIQQECIDEIARIVNIADEVAKITERAMRGELDFNHSFRHRVNLLKGASKSVFDQVRELITFTPGVFDLIRVLKHLGVKIAVVSGGFQPLVDYVKETLSLDYGHGNHVEIDSSGFFTGQVIDPIVDGERKAQILRELAKELQLNREQIVAVGDGANDLLMMAAAGHGIAFNAKPKVQQAAAMRINQPSLLNVLYLMGFTSKDISCALEN